VNFIFTFTFRLLLTFLSRPSELEVQGRSGCPGNLRILLMIRETQPVTESSALLLLIECESCFVKTMNTQNKILNNMPTDMGLLL